MTDAHEALAQVREALVAETRRGGWRVSKHRDGRDALIYDADEFEVARVCYPNRDANAAFIAAANPKTIKQLVELVRLQHEALLRFETHYECEDTFYSCPSHETAWEDRKGKCCCGADGANEAIEAFNNFERNH